MMRALRSSLALPGAASRLGLALLLAGSSGCSDEAASLGVSNSNTVSAQIEGIPVGTGYTVTLLGNGAQPSETSCTGSAAFAIVAGQTTEVPVAVACHVHDEAVPPVAAAAVPIPPFAPLVLGLLLLAAGSAPRRRRG